MLEMKARHSSPVAAQDPLEIDSGAMEDELVRGALDTALLSIMCFSAFPSDLNCCSMF